MTDFLDGLARAVAQPMPRSRAIRLVCGAIAAAVVPTALRSPFARGAAVTVSTVRDCAPCGPTERGPTLCQQPRGVGCLRACCKDGETCCTAADAITCCAPGYHCGPTKTGPGGAQLPTCECNVPCGTACCQPTEVCADAATSFCCSSKYVPCHGPNNVTCCKPDQVCCNGACCPSIAQCYQGACQFCPPGTTACGSTCCPRGRKCVKLNGHPTCQ